MIGSEVSVKRVVQQGPSPVNSIPSRHDHVVGGSVELYQLKALLMKG